MQCGPCSVVGKQLRLDSRLDVLRTCCVTVGLLSESLLPPLAEEVVGGRGGSGSWGIQLIPLEAFSSSAFPS